MQKARSATTCYFYRIIKDLCETYFVCKSRVLFVHYTMCSNTENIRCKERSWASIAVSYFGQCKFVKIRIFEIRYNRFIRNTYCYHIFALMTKAVVVFNILLIQCLFLRIDVTSSCAIFFICLCYNFGG